MLNTQRQLNVQIRNKHGKGPARALRREGKIPGILYGQGGDHLAISVDPREFHKALDPIRKLNTYFKLTVSDGQKTHDEDVIIADHQIDVIRNLVTHIDFMRVDPELEVQRTIAGLRAGRDEVLEAGLGVIRSAPRATVARGTKRGRGVVPRRPTPTAEPSSAGKRGATSAAAAESRPRTPPR